MRKSLTSRFKSNKNANVFEITFHRLELYYYDLATNSKSFIELNYHKMNFSWGFLNECIFLFVFSRLKIRLSREKELKAITEFCVRCGWSHSRSRVAYRFSDKVTSKPVSALSRPDNWSATMDLTSTAGGSGSLPIPDLSPGSSLGLSLSCSSSPGNMILPIKLPAGTDLGAALFCSPDCATSSESA